MTARFYDQLQQQVMVMYSIHVSRLWLDVLEYEYFIHHKTIERVHKEVLIDMAKYDPTLPVAVTTFIIGAMWGSQRR
jgi:hypothetical protein